MLDGVEHSYDKGVAVNPQKRAFAYRGPDRREGLGGALSRYRGPDRRSVSPLAADARPFWYVAIGGATLALCAVVAWATEAGGTSRVVTFTALRDSGAGLLVLAGTVTLVLWALTGRAARVFDGCALLLVGGGLLIFAGPWSALLHDQEIPRLLSPGARVAVGIPALVLFLRAGRVTAVDSSARPRHLLAVAATSALGIAGVEAIARLAGPVDRPAMLTALLTLLAAGWIVAGALRLAKPTEQIVAGELTFGWALIAFGAGDAMLATSLQAGLGWAVLGAVLQLVGAAGVTRSAVTCLIDVLEHEGGQRLWLSGELSEVTMVLADAQSVRRTLQHDARNVVTALRAATLTLQRHRDRISPELQEQLQDTIGSEFGRLQAMLDASADSASLL